MVTPSLSSYNTDKDMNPSTTKRRKKLRIARNKRKAVRYYTYIHSEQAEVDLNKWLRDFINNQQEMPKEFAEYINKNYRELLY